jgi:formate dehydrogenase subunit gamma
MSKTVKAYHPLEMAFHKNMIRLVIFLVITGLPFFSKSFSFIAYGVGYPISEFLGNGEPLSTGLTFLRVIHWSSGFILTIIAVLFLVAMVLKINRLSIWPDRWGITAVFDGIKQMRLHYLEGKPGRFGKMNMGQKASAWVMFFAMVAMVFSGIVLVLRNIDGDLLVNTTSLLVRNIHTVSFVVLAGVVVVHIFFALLPSNAKAFKAMFQTGEMDEEHVKEHHPLWYEKIK